jgi:hypothetical protein
MLPSHLTGSYQRYKTNTAIFTTWLGHTAAACGHQLVAARKQTKQPSAVNVGDDGDTRYSVPVSELLRQAQAVAHSGHAGLQLPASIHRIAE